METIMIVTVATAVLHNIARDMHEELPPPPEEINAEELEYLIQQGDIPAMNPQENILHDFRSEIINTYFANF